jgi:hypothetical protein
MMNEPPESSISNGRKEWHVHLGRAFGRLGERGIHRMGVNDGMWHVFVLFSFS